MNLIEREGQLGLFEERVRATSHGQGSVLLITGATATGKSTLLHAFRQCGRELGAVVLAATASRAEEDLPLGVFSQLLHAAALATGGRPPATAPAPAPAGGTTASGSTRAPDAPVDLPALEAMCAGLVKLSTDCPLVISVDDVEHADAASRQALLFLARRVHPVPITLVLSHADPTGYAGHAIAEDLARQAHCHTVHLSPLSKNGVRTLAYSLVGPEAGQRLHLPWFRLSGGNPLLVAALAEDYHASMRTCDEDGPVPPVVAAHYGRAVLAYLHRSAEPILHVARALAVLGDEDGLDQLVDLPRDDLVRSLHALAAGGLTAGGSLRHETARGAVLADMSTGERAAMHRAAAELTHRRGMPSAVVAEHLVGGGQITGSWGVDVLEDAAIRSLCENRVDRAIAYLRHARAGCSDERRRREITIKLVRAAWRLNPAICADRLGELAKATGHGGITDGYAVELVQPLLWHGRSELARDVLDTVIRSEPRHPGTVHALVVLREWMRCTYPLAVEPRLRELPQSANDGAATTVAALRRLEAARLLADVLSNGGRAGIASRAEQILTGCRPDDTSFDAIVWTLHALAYGDCLDRAQRWADALGAGIDAAYAPYWCARLAGIRSEIAARTGDMPAAERHARTALELIPPAG